MNRLMEIGTGVYVATGDLYVTNSTVVADADGGCLVIDPAVTVAELAGLAADLCSLELRPRAGFATHPHWDHVLWSSELGDLPRFASPLTVAVAERERAGLVEGVQRSAPGHDLDLFGRLKPLDQPDVITWDGPRALVITHQAHAPGHSAVFFPGSGTLVAGDMCSDIEIPLLDLDQADPIGDYLAALDQLAELPVERVIPGHGAVGDGAQFRRRIELDRAYLDNLRRGQDLRDPRPIAEWLITEHEKQRAWLAKGLARQSAWERLSGEESPRPAGSSGRRAEIRWTDADAGQHSRPRDYSHPVHVHRHDGPSRAGILLGSCPRVAPDIRQGRAGRPRAAGGQSGGRDSS